MGIGRNPAFQPASGGPLGVLSPGVRRAGCPRSEGAHFYECTSVAYEYRLVLLNLPRAAFIPGRARLFSILTSPKLMKTFAPGDGPRYAP